MRAGHRPWQYVFWLWLWNAVTLSGVLLTAVSATAQSRDWQSVIWREPQVRYLLADMSLGGDVGMYRNYATVERDPDSREAIRLWDAGVRVVNTADFERKWLDNKFGKDGRVLRIVHHGTNRTITGMEVVLDCDASISQTQLRQALAELTLGRSVKNDHGHPDPTISEALRRYADGVRALPKYELAATAKEGAELAKPRIVYRRTSIPVDPARIELNSDVAYPETNVRYFMADIALGGSLEFYRRHAEADHEMGCQEAVRRIEDGYKIVNVDEFERKKVNGKVTITRKGADERISGLEVRLSSDPADWQPPDKLTATNPAAISPSATNTLALKIAATAAATPELPPATQPGDLRGHKLLLTLVRTGDTEIFAVDPDSGDATNLTRSPQTEDRYPCWSPDGRRVAFTRDRGEYKDLLVMDATGENQHVIASGKFVCYMPSWRNTPAGERIVFGLHGEKPEMASCRPDGSDLQILGEGHDPTLSPDGKLICYTGHPPEGGVTVYVMNHDGTDKRRVVGETSTMGATFPNWSPDGREIVYSFPVEEALELFIIQADGTGQRQLTKFGGTNICTPAAWSPDGQWISFRRTDERYWSNPERMKLVYDTKPADKRPVWVVRPDGGDAKVIECLRFQCAIDGSRASWFPTKSDKGK